MTIKPLNGPAVKVAAAAWLICLLIYLRALLCGFVNFDDTEFVLHNLIIRNPDLNFFKFVFSSPYIDFWMPLTWISLALDYHFWELNPLGYHLTNILLHATNTALVVLIADTVLRPFAREIFSNWTYPAMLLLAGLFFGIHPLRVESVAWVTERKDVLNGIFTLSSVLFYLMYVQRKEADANGRNTGVWLYMSSLMLFTLSLMAKSISVVLPVILLTIDWFPLGRVRKSTVVRLVFEKIPFLFLSLAVSYLTIHFAQQGGLFLSHETLPLYKRLLVSGNAVFEYVRLLLCPTGIRPFYIIPAQLPVSYALKTTVIIAAGCYSLSFIKRRPWIPALWLFFVVPLLPVLAFLQNGGEQAMAARFTYLPSVAPALCASYAIFSMYRYRQKLRLLLLSIVTALLLFYAGVSYKLITVWDNTGTLWSRVLDAQTIGRAYVQRGMYYYSIARYDSAVQDLSQALVIAEREGIPVRHNLYAFRGDSYRAMGKYELAVADLTAAITIAPNTPCYHLRAMALRSLGRSHEAKEDFDRAGPNPMPLEWY